jgi:hypothetical protein
MPPIGSPLCIRSPGMEVEPGCHAAADGEDRISP